MTHFMFVIYNRPQDISLVSVVRVLHDVGVSSAA
jgi:hypothetical protein